MASRISARGAVAAASLLAALGAPAAASAAVRCVPNTSPGGCTTSHATIQAAVDFATTGDTIRIAPGNYAEAVLGGSKVLTFVGSGQNTVIQPPASASGSAGMALSHGGTVRTLKVVGGTRNDFSGAGAAGIRFLSPGDFTLVLDRVEVTAGSSPGGGSNGGHGVQVENGSDPANDTRVDVRSSTLKGGENSGPAGGAGLSMAATGGRVSITNSSLTGSTSSGRDGAGLTVTKGGPVSVVASSFRGFNGIAVESTSFTASRSRITGADSGDQFASGLYVNTGAGTSPTRATVYDSLVTSEQGTSPPISFAAAVVDPVGAAVSLDARGSTFVGRGASQGGVVVQGHPTYPPATAALRNSVVRLVGAGAEAAELKGVGGPGRSITASNSSFTTSRADTTEPGASVPAPGSGTNISGDPRLAADLSLLPSSPLIDRGDPSFVTAGELDLAGAPRSRDGNGDCSVRPDVGAFERPAVLNTRCLVVGNVRPGVASFRMTNKVFAPVPKGGKITASARRRRAVKLGTRFRYTLSEPGRVTITVERRGKGRRVKRKGKRVCAKPTRKNRRKRRCTRYKRVGRLGANKPAGRQTTPFTGRFKGKALKRGRYRATIVVKDAQGAKSKPRRVSFRIVKRR